MKQLIFVTGNKDKLAIAQRALRNTDIILAQKKIRIPEIQSLDVEEIACFSAGFAAKEVGRAVVVADAGYYIEALGGFPGPFIKYVNQWFNPEDFLRLMEGKKNRRVVVKGSLAYCEPLKHPVVFKFEAIGAIAKKTGRVIKGGWGNPINRVFIHNGFEKPESEILKEKLIELWAKLETCWQKLADYLAEK